VDLAYAFEGRKEIESMRTLRDCYDDGHEVVEDTLVEMYCVERLFYCRDCKVYFVCAEETGEVISRTVLPGTMEMTEISQYLTLL